MNKNKKKRTQHTMQYTNLTCEQRKREKKIRKIKQKKTERENSKKNENQVIAIIII
jgi:hypothetical protein